jgi:hypothetical protein
MVKVGMLLQRVNLLSLIDLLLWKYKNNFIMSEYYNPQRDFSWNYGGKNWKLSRSND